MIMYLYSKSVIYLPECNERFGIVKAFLCHGNVQFFPMLTILDIGIRDASLTWTYWDQRSQSDLHNISSTIGLDYSFVKSVLTMCSVKKEKQGYY